MACREEKGELHEVVVPWWLQHRTPILKHSRSEQEYPSGTGLGAGRGSKRGMVKVGNTKCESWSTFLYIYIHLAGVESVWYWKTSKDHRKVFRSHNSFVLCFGLMSPRFSVLFLPLLLLEKSCSSDRKEESSGSVPGFSFHVWHQTLKWKRATPNLEIDSQECKCIWKNSVCTHIWTLCWKSKQQTNFLL